MNRSPGLLPTAVLAVAAFGCVVLLCLALVLQHAFGMHPCSWCVLQRLLFLLVGLCCLLAAWSPGGRWSRCVLAALAVLASLAGLAAALHQQFVASRSASCAMTLADRIVMQLSLHELAPWMFMPTAPCNEANVALLGVPFAVWSALAFAVLGVAAALALRGARGGRAPAG